MGIVQEILQNLCDEFVLLIQVVGVICNLMSCQLLLVHPFYSYVPIFACPIVMRSRGGGGVVCVSILISSTGQPPLQTTGVEEMGWSILWAHCSKMFRHVKID